MMRIRLRNILVTVVACASAFAQPPVNHVAEVAPDLRISEFVFAAANKKLVRVHLENVGGTASPLCILRLTVRKINGVPAGRVMEVKLPPLAPGKDKWVVIDASRILPINVALTSTTFKLNADATLIVTESNEANNEVWHNL